MWLEALQPKGVISGFAVGWDLDVVEACVSLKIALLEILGLPSLRIAGEPMAEARPGALPGATQSGRKS